MERGRKAEEIVMQFLRKRPDIIEVSDWRELRQARSADVDCAIYWRDGTTALAEIKSDSYLGVTPNVLFEVLRINHTATTDVACTLGWSMRSPAKFFLYYASQRNSLYVCLASKLRKAMQRYTAAQRKNTRISYVETDNIKSTINILIPWDYCKDIFTIFDLND